MRFTQSRIRLRVALAALALALFAASPAFAMEAPDPWITTKVKMALLTADDVPFTGINVDTVDGRVTLHGTVATDVEKVNAEKAARSIDGVRTVQNLLQIVPASRKEAVQVSDAELQKNVEAVLKRDAALEDSSVKVASVHDGVVLLSGSAKTLSAHRRALEDVRAVPGVKRVSSEIQSPDRLGDAEIFSKGPMNKESSMKSAAYDAWITTDAKTRLLATADVPALSINVDTNGGVVTLFGTVPNEMAKKRAEIEVKKISGVRAVENDLEIVPKSMAKAVDAKDDDIRKDVDSRLEARPELKDANINTQVENGVVRLTGSVASQSDRLIALATTRSVPGVRSVIDDLSVTSVVSSR